MPVNVIGTLKPKNNGKFPVAEAVDIKVTDNQRLDEALENKADFSSVNFALAGKADNSDINNLQAQINEIITPVTQDAEVQNARVGIDGTSHTTLKERLDYEESENRSAVLASKSSPYGVWNYLSDGKKDTGCLIYKAVGETVGAPYASQGNTYIEIPCTSGDIFEISAKANASLGLWTFVDDERKVISKNAYGEVDTTNNPLKLSAPDGSYKLLVTLITGYSGYVVKFGSKIYDYITSSENSIVSIEGTNETFVVSSTGVNKFDALIKKGIPYTYTNNTGGQQSLILYAANGDRQEITQSFSSGESRIIIPNADYDQIGGYYNGTGTAILTSDSVVDTEINVKKGLIESIIFEQGTIDISGAKVNSTARLRTASKLNGSFDFYLPDGFVIVTIAYYNNDNTFDSYIQPTGKSYWKVVGKQGKYVQIAIKKSDDSDITVSDLKTSDALEDTANKFMLAWINSTVFEDGSIYSTGANAVSTERIRTRYKLSGKQSFALPEGFLFAKIVYYNKDGSFYSATDLNSKTYTVTNDTYDYRLVVKNKDASDITVSDLKQINSLETMQERIDLNSEPPMVEFEIDHTLPDTEDVSADIEDLNFNSTGIVQDIYEKWDALAEEYSEYITREDVAELLELEYPEYATYNTYVYKLSENGSKINGTYTRRRTALLIGNLHGDEVCSPFVLYRIAKRLCECSDINAMKLRAAYDIYIIPSINEYGSIHKTRTNGNGVDINRNFPTKSWNEGGSGTDRYTGPYAGSEFETQVIMGLTDLLKCDICIDFHNYVSLDWQFYTETAMKELLPISYKCLVDMSYSFIQNMPDYFGTKYKLFIDTNASAPKSFLTSAYQPGRNTVWWWEEKDIVSATIEMSANINYLNGEINHQANYTADAFAVGEYTYWVQLLKYAEYALRNTV